MSQLTQASGVEKLRSACKMAVVLTGNAVFFMVPMSIVPTLPSMAKTFAQHGAANGLFQAQLILSISGLTSIFGAPIVPLAAKRIGKRTVLLAMFLLYALAGSVGIFESNFVPLLISRAVLGVAGGGIASLSIILIANYYEERVKFRLLGFSSTVQTLVATLAMVLCGALADRFGWQTAFAVYPVAGLIMFGAGWFAIVEPSTAKSAKAAGPKAPVFREYYPVYPVYLITLIVAIGLFMGPLQGPFLLASIGVKKATILGLLAAIPTMAAMVAGLFFGYFHSKFSERWIVISTTGIIGAGIAAAGISYSIWEIAICYLATGLAIGLMLPMSLGMIISRASVHIRDAAVGVIFSMVGIAQFLNPILCAPITKAFGVSGAFIGIGALVVALMLVLMLGGFGHGMSRVASDFEAISGTDMYMEVKK